MTTIFRPLLLVVMAALTLLGCGRERVQITVPDDSQLQAQLAQETKSSEQNSTLGSNETRESATSSATDKSTSKGAKTPVKTETATPTAQKSMNSIKPQPATGQLSVSMPNKKSGLVENNPQEIKSVPATTKTNSVTSSIQQGIQPAIPVEKSDSSQAQSASPRTTEEGIPLLSFGEFFDGDDRTTPANRFWDLKGTTVKIHGFMGEVLSLEKHWFLLIPAPGAECPFDNGDGTLWNEIMIVFVKDGETLRYTRGPLKIKGTLDVGVKVDQSGYRTMFRMQDATFETME